MPDRRARRAAGRSRAAACGTGTFIAAGYHLQSMFMFGAAPLTVLL
jgi:hypothetical protein